MTIETGQLIVADEVMNAFARIFKNQVNLIWNADLVGFSANLNQDFLNLKYNILKLEGVGDITTVGDIHTCPIFGATLLDEHSDNSLDSSIWTHTGTGTTIEESNLRLKTVHTQTISSGTGSSKVVEDGASGIDFNQTCVIYVGIDAGNETGGSASTAATSSIILQDTSANSVTLFSKTDDGAYYDVRMEVDTAGNNVKVYTNDINGIGSFTNISITSLVDGNEWHLGYVTTGQSHSTSGVTSTTLVYYTRFTNGSSGAVTAETDAATSSSTITNCFLGVSESLGTSTTITYALSADNGVNFESVTPNQIHRFANTGTQLKMRATLTPTSTKVPILKHYAINYNLY